MPNLFSEIFDLEKKLLLPTVRNDAEQIRLLLSPDFKEIGSSGKAFNFDEILELLASETDVGPLYSKDFKGQFLADDTVLITYKTCRSESFETGELRSSIWSKKSGSWQMLFHQGTKCFP